MMNMNSGGGMMGDGGAGSATVGTGGADPAQLISQAIQLHAAHLNGSEPTSPESQERLMILLQEALSALNGAAEPEDSASNQALVSKMMQMGMGGMGR